MITIIYESENKEFRILEIVDEDYSIDDLKGDCFNPAHINEMNPGLLLCELKYKERDFEEQVRQEGVFGYVLERWNPEIGVGYEHIDSCWGFIGQYNPNDERFNHYIVDELKSQIK